jgi:hypothetical protein
MRCGIPGGPERREFTESLRRSGASWATYGDEFNRYDL